MMECLAADSTMGSVRTIQEMQAAPLQLTDYHHPASNVWIRSLFSTMTGESSMEDCTASRLARPSSLCAFDIPIPLCTSCQEVVAKGTESSSLESSC